MATNSGEWITVSEAAELSGYHPETLRELVRDGKIKGRKVSIVWLIDPESLSAYMTKVKAMGDKRGPKPED
jgi:excisionase family DNA binding protein